MPSRSTYTRHYYNLAILMMFLGTISLCCGENENNKNLKENRNNEEIYKSDELDKKIMDLKHVLMDYLNDTLSKSVYEVIPGINIVKDTKNVSVESGRSLQDSSFGDIVFDSFKAFSNNHVLSVNVPRAVQTGRLFFFKGLKKIMWPIFIGVQIAKTILLALFLPSILGSFGKIIGKGLSGFAGSSVPPAAEHVDDLDFKDNSYNSDQDIMSTDYSYPSDGTSNMANTMYDAAASNNALSRFGAGGQKVTYINSAGDNFYSQNTNSLMKTKKNDFKVFQDIPASSMLLTNYDPFYSPLLSRLDAVFQQLGLTGTQEQCREKLICLMYSNPAKYAPYSNLISAQLSRELNELRKPSSDNPDILRFFKYMRAAKDGQDMVDCEAAFKECTSLKDSDNPVMITTYNDINKLVQARKLY